MTKSKRTLCYIDWGRTAECDDAYANVTIVGLKRKERHPEHAVGSVLHHNFTQPAQRRNGKLDIEFFSLQSDQCPSAAGSVR